MGGQKYRHAVPDVFTRDKRSAVMAAIRSKDTKPELLIRTLLHRMGYRFRLHANDLPGRPDIVLPKFKTIIQVRGCYWHGHSCLGGRTTKVHRSYWAPKIAGNKARDRRNDAQLRRMGWKVKTVWECRIRASDLVSISRNVQRLMGAKDLRAGTFTSHKASTLLKRMKERKVHTSKQRRAGAGMGN